jgi:hypothetical protein
MRWNCVTETWYDLAQALRSSRLAELFPQAAGKLMTQEGQDNVKKASSKHDELAKMVTGPRLLHVAIPQLVQRFDHLSASCGRARVFLATHMLCAWFIYIIVGLLFSGHVYECVSCWQAIQEAYERKELVIMRKGQVGHYPRHCLAARKQLFGSISSFGDLKQKTNLLLWHLFSALFV